MFAGSDVLFVVSGKNAGSASRTVPYAILASDLYDSERTFPVDLLN